METPKKSTDILNKMNDEELIVESKTGNGYATEILMERYRNFVRARSRTYFLIGADKEDIIQEGMIGLYKAIRDFKTEANTSFKSFAELCITRQIITAIKKATRQKHIPLNSYVSLNKPLYDEDNDNALLDTFVRREILNPEEILLDKEKHAATKHDKIFIEQPINDVEKLVAEIYALREGLSCEIPLYDDMISWFQTEFVTK